jgi:hypothetical protein
MYNEHNLMRVPKTLGFYMWEMWQTILVAAGAIVVVVTLLWFRLGTLTHGRSTLEIPAVYHLSLHDIAHNPVNLPYRLGLYVLGKADIHSLWAVRSLSSLVGLCIAVAFFAILHRWHTNRMALFGTFLFVSSSWFLRVSRFGSPEVLLFSLLLLVLCGLWLRNNRSRLISVYLLACAGALLLYIPGMVWFVGAAIVWQRKLFTKEISEVNKALIFSAIVLFIILLLPLGWAIAHTPSLIRPILGLPDALPSPLQIGKNLFNVPLFLFVRGPKNPALWLGRLPILDIFTTAMFALGVYAYYIRRRLSQARFLLGILIISAVLITLGGPVTITILLPFIYIVVIAGIALMLQQWFTVFPRNPLARGIGVGLLSAAILLASFYQLNRYFVAWPNTPETRAAFSIKQ